MLPNLSTFQPFNLLTIFDDVNRGLVEDLVRDELLADDVLFNYRLCRGGIDVPVDHGRHARDDDLDRRLGVAQAHAPRLADEHVRTYGKFFETQ